jgi:hypothetical protein
MMITFLASRSNSAVSGELDRYHLSGRLGTAGGWQPAVPPVSPEAAGDDADEVAIHRLAHMMYERIAPLDPTSAPVTIRRSFESMKPVAAAAQPE